MSKSKNTKKPPQHHPTCIFCGERPLTEEHLFSDWIRNVIPREGDLTFSQFIFNTDLIYSGVALSPVVLVSPMVKKRAGHIGNQKVKVVCAACNNGWMNQIEQQVKPIFIPLMTDSTAIINSSDQLVICQWAMLKTIIGEYTDIPNKALKSNELEAFMNTKKPEHNWKIWIARCDGEISLAYHHMGASAGNHPLFPPSPGRNTQVSVFVLKHLLIYTFHSTIDFDYNFTPYLYHRMIPIYPEAHSSLDWSKAPVITKDDYEFIRLSHQKIVYQ